MLSTLLALQNPEAVNIVKTSLKNMDLSLTHVKDGTLAMSKLAEDSYGLVLAEKDLPNIDGMALIEHIQVKHPGLRVVILSEDPTARSAIEVMRAGAFDYLTLPLNEKELLDCLDRAINKVTYPGIAPPSRPMTNGYSEIIGQSRAIKEVFSLIDKVAATDSTIMITGESGTGKELIARAIHMSSPRKKYPLIPVNCGAIPEELLESELFGHEKGAFTSAIRTRIGRFELADQGTIFLDEIADMSPKLQIKILRVLQERKFERIGGTRTIEVDIRIITATNKDLYQAMREGLFREDLYYRLNVIPITTPTLMERRSDIPLLIDHFLPRFNQNKEEQIVGIASELVDVLMSYSWPGNIRELENVIERMVILAEGDTLTLDDLPPLIKEVTLQPGHTHFEIPDEGINFNKVVSDFEDRILIQALDKAGWVKNQAAKMLSLNRTTLVEKLKKKKITPPEFS
jgi:DNA-binding NtrC family response regulator